MSARRFLVRGQNEVGPTGVSRGRSWLSISFPSG